MSARWYLEKGSSPKKTPWVRTSHMGGIYGTGSLVAEEMSCASCRGSLSNAARFDAENPKP